ncbi:MAG: alanine racemase [Eubacterium sp.]|nr:alanine racemase [Eubacterium sp.]
MYKEALRPAWVEIDLKAFDRNIKNIIAKADGRKFIGVIKADAYGHGAVRCAEVLRANGIDTFAIATLQEAIELREAGAKETIIMLGLTPAMYADTIVKYDITPVVCCAKNAAAISEAACTAGKVVEGLIAVDTGMGRIGYMTETEENIAFAVEDVKKIAALPGFKIKGMFSHMATADAFDKTFSHQQEAKYNRIYEAFTAAGIEIPFRTLANSASVMELPSVLFDGVRPGIIQYGQYPSDEVDRSLLELTPVMSVKANIVHLKNVPVGFSCGYGRKFIAERPSRIATLALGYADGYPRPYSAYAKVIVNGVVCPVAGNICMDQCMVDVTDVPEVHVGDEVIIMGSDGVNSVTAEDIANATGTINYEICCAFGQRLPKVYID